MTDRPKNEPGQETDTAPSPDNVISVDFGKNGSDIESWVTRERVPSSETRLQVFMIEQPPTIGLRFSQDVNEFRMDISAADHLIGALVQAYMKLKGGGDGA